MPNFTSDQFATFVAIAVFLLGAVALVFTVFKRQPPLHKEYVDRESYTKDREQISAEFGRQARNRKELYDKVEDMSVENEKLRGEVAVLRAETQAQTRQLTNLDGKMDQVLLRLPRK